MSKATVVPDTALIHIGIFPSRKVRGTVGVALLPDLPLRNLDGCVEHKPTNNPLKMFLDY